MRWLAFFVVLASVGCGSSERGSSQVVTGAAEERTEQTAPEPAQLEVRDGLFRAEGSPDPRACSAAADCVGGTVPDVAQPCCNDPRSLQAYGGAYRAWVQSWRASHCADVRCPPPPPPARPPECAFDMRCLDGRCADSCE